MDQSVWDTIAQWSEIIGGVAFIVVAVWLFRKLVLPVIVRTTERKNAELLDAEKHRDALRARVAEARERVAEADREASAIEARAFGDAQREHEQIVDEARREGTRLLLNAQGELERARIAARDDLRITFIEKALRRARELATARVDDALNTRLVERTIDDVVKGRP